MAPWPAPVLSAVNRPNTVLDTFRGTAVESTPSVSTWTEVTFPGTRLYGTNALIWFAVAAKMGAGYPSNKSLECPATAGKTLLLGSLNHPEAGPRLKP